ncbi:hypothetical protein EC990672_5847A, partial [Escherichia coli 99.0672]
MCILSFFISTEK